MVGVRVRVAEQSKIAKESTLESIADMIKAEEMLNSYSTAPCLCFAILHTC